MKIHQVSVRYVNEQDRLLLRINTHAGEELRLWFTRRLTLSLLPALKATSTDQMKRYTAPANPVAPLEEQRQRMLENFQKEAAAYSGDYATPYKVQTRAVPSTTHGTEPWLICEVKLSLRATGQLQVQLFEKLPDQTRNVQLMMDPPLAQGLLKLLNQALKKSQWLELPSQTAGLESSANTDNETDSDSSAPPDGADKPKYLN